jgi:hypothetical protein
MCTWGLNFVLQCLKTVEEGQNMLYALLDLINLLCLTIIYLNHYQCATAQRDEFHQYSGLHWLLVTDISGQILRPRYKGRSLQDFKYTSRDIPEERDHQLQSGGSLKSDSCVLYYNAILQYYTTKQENYIRNIATINKLCNP